MESSSLGSGPHQVGYRASCVDCAEGDLTGNSLLCDRVWGLYCHYLVRANWTWRTCGLQQTDVP